MRVRCDFNSYHRTLNKAEIHLNKIEAHLNKAELTYLILARKNVRSPKMVVIWILFRISITINSTQKKVKMSRKFSITLSDGIHKDLVRLCKKDGEQPASMAALYVTRAIEDARLRGDLKGLTDEVISSNLISPSGCIDAIELQRLAIELDIPTSKLADILALLSRRSSPKA